MTALRLVLVFTVLLLHASSAHAYHFGQPHGAICFSCGAPPTGGDFGGGPVVITGPDYGGVVLGYVLPPLDWDELLDKDLSPEQKEVSRIMTRVMGTLAVIPGLLSAGLGTASEVALELINISFAISPAVLNELLTHDGTPTGALRALFLKGMILLITTAASLLAAFAIVEIGSLAIPAILVASTLSWSALVFDFYANDPPNFDYANLVESEYSEIPTPLGAAPNWAQAITVLNSSLRLSDAIYVLVRSREKLFGAQIDETTGVDTHAEQALQSSHMALQLLVIEEEIARIKTELPIFFDNLESQHPGLLSIEASEYNAFLDEIPTAPLSQSFLNLLDRIGVTEEQYRTAAYQDFLTRQDELVGANFEELLTSLLTALEQFATKNREELAADVIIERRFTSGALPSGTAASLRFDSADPACLFDEAPRFLSASELALTPPSSITLVDGVIQFAVTGCSPGATVNLTLDYGSDLPAGARYFKAGSPWREIPATISGSTVSFSITDGGEFDDDGLANGRIVDPSGASLAAPIPAGPTAAAGATAGSNPKQIPINQPLLLLFSAFGLAILGGLAYRKRRF